jgi:hypothetical protein
VLRIAFLDNQDAGAFVIHAFRQARRQRFEERAVRFAKAKVLEFDDKASAAEITLFPRVDAYPIDLPVDMTTLRLWANAADADHRNVVVVSDAPHTIEDPKVPVFVRIPDVSSFVDEDAHDRFFLFI